MAAKAQESTDWHSEGEGKVAADNAQGQAKQSFAVDGSRGCPREASVAHEAATGAPVDEGTVICFASDARHRSVLEYLPVTTCNSSHKTVDCSHSHVLDTCNVVSIR